MRAIYDHAQAADSVTAMALAKTPRVVRSPHLSVGSEHACLVRPKLDAKRPTFFQTESSSTASATTSTITLKHALCGARLEVAVRFTHIFYEFCPATLSQPPFGVSRR
mmetsp:Transcript_47865/g.79216  ORF Transcript_47865/g.79216 Transcript_47865/m.79216 type:complete len:108 (+) Transcript_47865:342-665(+)